MAASQGGKRMALISNLGHVGIICDDFLKMRDFYTRVLGLTVTDEDPERGSCFLSADPANEHHELNLGQARPAPDTACGPGVLYRAVDGGAAGIEPAVPGRAHQNSSHRYPRHFQ